MTFLLFLTSLAVMEYLLRKPRKKQDDAPKGVHPEGGAVEVPLTAVTTMPGLFALGRALEAQGRGMVPGVESAPRVHLPPVDGV